MKIITRGVTNPGEDKGWNPGDKEMRTAGECALGPYSSGPQLLTKKGNDSGSDVA